MKELNGQLVSAEQELQALWAAGRYDNALRLVARWPRLGTHRDAIQRGWAACTNPALYEEMGQDSKQLYHDGLAAVATRYNLQPCGIDP